LSAWRATARAEDDLLDIWRHVATDNPVAADRLLDRINGTFALLAETPRLGPARRDVGHDMRYFVVGSYLILYRPLANGVEIVRVVHGARRLTGLF
jgi:toxin ParE1/3/4